jgi:hypothetical protein
MPCYLSNYFDHLSRAGIEENILFLKSPKAYLYKRAVSKKENMVWVKIDRCRRCHYKEDCHGILQEYLDNYGDKEVRPIISS